MIEQKGMRWTDLLQPLVVCQKSLLTTSQRQIGYLETLLSETGDLTQETDLLRFQEAMNKQAQLMQMLSNIMKSMDDTSKAIIQNLK